MSLQNATNSFDPASSHDDFLDQMLSGLQSGASWPEISAGGGGGNGWDVDQFDDQSNFLATKLRQHQISSGPSSAAKSLILQQQMMISRGLAGAGELGNFQNDMVDASSFKSPVNSFFRRFINKHIRNCNMIIM